MRESLVGDVHPEEDGLGPRSHSQAQEPRSRPTSGAAEGGDVEVKPLICVMFKGKEGDKIISQFCNALRTPLRLNHGLRTKGKR